MTLAVEGGLVVRSLSPSIVEQADLVLGADRVLAVGHVQTTSGERIDASGCLVVPGNVNAHAHAYSALARGMPSRLPPATSFLEILQRVWWRLDRALDVDTIRASALVAGREALLSGTTTLIDHHASPNAIDGSLDVIAEAFESLGLRCVLCHEVSDRDGPVASRAAIHENERFIDDVAHQPRRRTRAMIGAHASFTLSDETLAACVDVAARRGVGMHIHAAEGAVDTRAVARLVQAAALNERTLLAHAVHLDDDEAAAVAEARSFVVHNGRSNMNNGVGRAPIDKLGGRVALGTDGIGADMYEEARTTYLRQREQEPEAGPGWAISRLAAGATLAAEIFDEPLLGRIACGAPADLVVLDYAAPTPVDATNLPAHLVFAGSAAKVRDVIVDGEVVVRNGRLTRVDEDALLADAQFQAARLWERVDEIPAHDFSTRAHWHAHRV